MKSLGDVLRLATSFLSERKVDRARRIVEELVAHLLKCKRIDLYLQFDRPMDEGELEILRGWLKRVVLHEPVEYITGEINFFGCSIKVDRRALIPRQETEILVDRVAKKLKGNEVLWDLCTGSGCIGISLKKKFPGLTVSISDISPEALSLAQENAKLNGVEVEFLLGDLLDPFEGCKAEVIICNPPYISSQEFSHLDPSVRDFEPHQALVGGLSGLEFYERLSQNLSRYLSPRGQVFLEIGETQGKAVQDIFSLGDWLEKKGFQDFSHKDRFFFLEKQ